MILIGSIEKTVFLNKYSIQIKVTMTRINAEHFKIGYLEFGTANWLPRIQHQKIAILN